MGVHISSILSEILEKRIRELGFESLRKFHIAHRPRIGVSYELFRQVMHGGRIPRIESLLPILQAAQIPPSAIRTLLSRLYPHLQEHARQDLGNAPDAFGGPDPEAADGSEPPSGNRPPHPASLPPDWGPGGRSPSEIARNLSAALSRIPIRGYEDLWEMASRLSEIAENKVRERGRGRIDQPFLFGKEPEAIYQFLVRRGKAVPFMSRGEECALEFRPGIDYADRFRGALLGQAAGAAAGFLTQGLSAGDVRALYGRVESPRDGRAGGNRAAAAVLTNSGLSSLLSGNPIMDPEPVASAIAREILSQDVTEGEIHFSANLLERGFPWFEAGEAVAESAAAVRCIPFALLHAADFRRLKLESGICATITHPHPSAIAGAALLAISIGRLLHTQPGSLDPIPFARSSAGFIAGIESDRSGVKSRAMPSLARKIGTELPALLLRRAPIEEIVKSVGNGGSPAEGIPFAFACVLSNPSDFPEAVLSAVNSGNDAIRNGAMAGALSGALLGASAIPRAWLERIGGTDALAASADGLLKHATRA
jgi:ADP-ribosylglycohydrolase